MKVHGALLVLVAAMCGCTARTGAPVGAKILVQEFVIPATSSSSGTQEATKLLV
jgi:hypothetical protein